MPSLLVATYKAWDADEPWRMSAIVAYYAVLALPAFLVIIINMVGSVWGMEIVQGQLTDEISTALGRDAATAIETMISETLDKERNLVSTIIGIATLLFGATGVFYHLQISLNKIWKIEPTSNIGFLKMLLKRVRSFAFIMVIGFLLLISFLITAAISALNDYIHQILPEIVLYIAYIFDLGVSIGIITVLFALLFKYLPDAKIRWSTVWIGAFITALLFVLGKFLIGFYFGKADPGSTYGAAGTIVLILLWVSYSCLILFFGAEFTWVFSDRYGLGIEPDSDGIRVKDKTP